ncbi:MAG: hypothetical protein KJO63_14955 [Maribacter sp.]|nr:hypothetical protein [Maribacter sp.]
MTCFWYILVQKGALLTTNKQVEHILAPTQEHTTTNSAEDSMVTGMLPRLQQYKSVTILR